MCAATRWLRGQHLASCAPQVNINQITGHQCATRARLVRIKAVEGHRVAAPALPALTAAAARHHAPTHLKLLLPVLSFQSQQWHPRRRHCHPQCVLLGRTKDPLGRHRASRALLARTAAAGKCRALCVRPAVTKAEAGNRVAAPALPALTAAAARHHVPTHGHRLLHPLPPARPMAVCCNVPWVNAVIVALWLRNELPCHLPIFPPFYT